MLGQCRVPALTHAGFINVPRPPDRPKYCSDDSDLTAPKRACADAAGSTSTAQHTGREVSGPEHGGVRGRSVGRRARAGEGGQEIVQTSALLCSRTRGVVLRLARRGRRLARRGRGRAKRRWPGGSGGRRASHAISPQAPSTHPRPAPSRTTCCCRLRQSPTAPCPCPGARGWPPSPASSARARGCRLGSSGAS